MRKFQQNKDGTFQLYRKQIMEEGEWLEGEAVVISRPSWAWRSNFNVLHLLGNWFNPSYSANGLIWSKKEDKELTVRNIYNSLTELQAKASRISLGNHQIIAS
ncbi:hypothetical protein QQ045_006637 [Rhodiola kirilowii]